MNDWWDYESPSPKKEEEEIPWSQKFCFHEWKPIVLVISTVYDCVRCGAKKEEVDTK